jgi:hypothetical protein
MSDPLTPAVTIFNSSLIFNEQGSIYKHSGVVLLRYYFYLQELIQLQEYLIFNLVTAAEKWFVSLCSIPKTAALL